MTTFCDAHMWTGEGQCPDCEREWEHMAPHEDDGVRVPRELLKRIVNTDPVKTREILAAVAELRALLGKEGE